MLNKPSKHAQIFFKFLPNLVPHSYTHRRSLAFAYTLPIITCFHASIPLSPARISVTAFTTSESSRFISKFSYELAVSAFSSPSLVYIHF